MLTTLYCFIADLQSSINPTLRSILKNFTVLKLAPKKKFIANKNMGMIEKKYNTSSVTKINKTLIEAQY